MSAIVLKEKGQFQQSTAKGNSSSSVLKVPGNLEINETGLVRLEIYINYIKDFKGIEIEKFNIIGELENNKSVILIKIEKLLNILPINLEKNYGDF